ncbi:MAG: hypothetical protein ACPGEC_01415 [Flavobacteriales bacterium]
MALRLNLSTLGHLYYVLVLFLYMYSPVLVFLPYSPSKFMILLVVAEAVLANNFKFTKFLVKHALLYGALIAYTIFILLFHGTIDEQTAPLEQIATHLIEMLVFGSLYVSNLIRRGYKFDDFVNLILQVVFIQTTFIFIQFISSEFRELMSIYLKTKFKPTGSFQWFRGISMSSTRLYDFSLVQSVFLVLIGFRLQNTKIKFIHVVQIAFIILSIICSGRTGFIGVAVFLALVTLQSINNGTFWSTTKAIGYSVAVILIAYNLLAVVFPSVYTSINTNILPWAFEFYYEFIETGELTTKSSAQLSDSHYYDLPDATLLHGDGMYFRIDGWYYGLTDAGYMRQALYFGVPGIIISIFIYLNAALFAIQNTIKTYRWFIPVFCLLLFVGHYKGDVFSGSLILNRAFYVCLFAFTLPVIEVRREKTS